ncbi:MAG: flavodoxin family protein, partial [Archaeoglobaceae archaeon]
MKVLGICGSPRKGANTEFALNFTLNELKELGFETERISLAEKEVKFCNHCGKCLEGKECPIKDDAKEVFDKMIAADAIIIASPVYSVSVSAQV